MLFTKSRLLLAGAAFGCLVAAAPASAQATRTWVSGVGDDLNPCTRTAPCKTFAGAVAKTAAAGEINCIDAGGFGTVTITKSITINCEIVQGSILATGTAGVIVNAGASDVVVLRGLDIQGGGTGTYGVRVLTVGALEVHNTTFSGFNDSSSGLAISFTPNDSGARLLVDGTKITHNNVGVAVTPVLGASADVVVNNSVIANNGDTGVQILPTSGGSTINKIQILGSVINNNGVGVSANSTSRSQTLVSGSTVANNTGAGLSAVNPQSKIYVTGSNIVNNGYGMTTLASGYILSYGDNVVHGNVQNDAPIAVTKM